MKPAPPIEGDPTQPAAANPVLSLRNLSVEFSTDDGTVAAVENVSLDVQPGETLGIVGESGCGKSVTAMSLLRLIPSPPGRITSGSAMFAGQDLLAIPADNLRRIRGRRIAMIFQEPSAALSPLLRVGDQMAEVLINHLGVSRAEADGISAEWLRKVGIPAPRERMLSYPFQLSGGMIQRVMIAMALMLEPELVIADEPTTALDVTIQAQILDLLRAMKKRDTALILITHDMGVVWEMCDRVIVMYASRVVEQASRNDLFHSPCHPYTRALLDSLMSMNEAGGRLTVIEGQVPSPLAYPPGCRFAARCPMATGRCRTESPRAATVGPGHDSACHFAETLADTPMKRRNQPP